MAFVIHINLVDSISHNIIVSSSGSTILSALQDLVSDISSNTSYTASFNYTAITSNSITNLSFKLNDYDCIIDNLALHIYTTGDPSINAGYFNLSLIDPGNCTELDCFTTEELEKLYQKALNVCKLCNCT